MHLLFTYYSILNLIYQYITFFLYKLLNLFIV
nr:MAG TPA: hypothetical protein [Caudoviricetes sp.]DAR63429.1 MAG TPA: hypothetical protein [Caudoviricetes sp.]DAU08881.1 MAG TPA: hypothetical protein [Caudoviricetes sp.]